MVTRGWTYLLVAVTVAAGLAFPGVPLSGCACRGAVACCGPSCTDNAHKHGPAPAAREEQGCCCGEEASCAAPAADTAGPGAGAPAKVPGTPCSCGASRRAPVIRKTPTPAGEDAFPAFSPRTAPAPFVAAAVRTVPPCAAAAGRDPRALLCVWTC